MSTLIAGAASGLVMASVFAGVAMLMLFVAVRAPPPILQAIFQRFPPSALAMSVVFLAYPVWAIIGAVMALLYEVSSEQVPGAGLGSPNLAFTVAVVVAAAAVTAP